MLTVISARSALRFFPLMGKLTEPSNKFTTYIPKAISPILRAYAATLHAGIWPNKAKYVKHAAAFAPNKAEKVLSNVISSNIADTASNAAYVAANLSSSKHIRANRAANVILNDYMLHNIVHFPPIVSDIKFITSGKTAKSLALQPLWWDELMPSDVAQDWKVLKYYLHNKNQDWEVWTSWYDDRLKGGIELIEAIEISEPNKKDYGRATFPNSWYKDPAKLNAALKAKIDDYWAGQATNNDIPSPNFASIRTIWKNGKLYIDPKAVDPDLEAKLAVANLLSLKDEMESFASSVAKSVRNFDNSYADLFTGTAVLITGDLPDSRTVFRLMKRETTLLSLEKTVSEQWPDALAAQYSALCTDLTDALDMFPDIRAFKRQQSNAEMERFDPTEVEEDINQRIDIMRSELGEKIIDDKIPDNIQNLALGDTTDVTTQNLENYDRLESTNNVMKALARGTNEGQEPQNLMQAMDQGYVTEFATHAVEGAKEAGKSDGLKFGKATARIRAANAVGKKLSEKYPKRFGWMKRLPWNK